MGHPEFHTTDRITSGFFWLHPNSVRLHFYTWNSMNWSKQLMRHYHRLAPPNLRKHTKHTWSGYWKSYLQTATSHLTTKFTAKLSEPPWARSHHPEYVTYRCAKSWNRCPKTHHTRAKLILMPFHRRWVHDIGEGTYTWCRRLLSNSKQLP